MKPKESIFVIPVKTAASYTAAYRAMPHESPNYAKAFTVRIEELDTLIAELRKIEGANAMRIYMAERPDGEGAQEQTVVLVGVKDFDPDKGDAGSDITEYPDPRDPEKILSGCYDFNYPCPDTCAKDSPLLGFEQKK